MKKETIEITITKAPLKRGEQCMGNAIALMYLQKVFAPGNEELAYKYMEVFKSSPDFNACLYAMEHLLNGKLVSNVYVMNLALVVREMENNTLPSEGSE